MMDRCGFCGSADGPFTWVEGVFAVLTRPRACPTVPAATAVGLLPDLTDAELRAGLDLLPAWLLA
jgi:hypothetical protein